MIKLKNYNVDRVFQMHGRKRIFEEIRAKRRRRVMERALAWEKNPLKRPKRP